MTQQFVRELALLGLCALVSVSACGSEAPRAAPSSEVAPGQISTVDNTPSTPVIEETAGSIELSLKVAGKQLDSMSYAVVGSGFATSGSLDVSHSTKVSGVIGGIPFGSNYALTMTGKGVGPAALDCSGSTSFDLHEVGPLPVSISITCKESAVVVEPTPAPVPPLAIVSLACMLAALGVLAQRRTAGG